MRGVWCHGETAQLSYEYVWISYVDVMCLCVRSCSIVLFILRAMGTYHSPSSRTAGRRHTQRGRSHTHTRRRRRSGKANPCWVLGAGCWVLAGRYGKVPVPIRFDAIRFDSVRLMPCRVQSTENFGCGCGCGSRECASARVRKCESRENDRPSTERALNPIYILDSGRPSLAVLHLLRKSEDWGTWELEEGNLGRTPHFWQRRHI
jgi:hypothetical protein